MMSSHTSALRSDVVSVFRPLLSKVLCVCGRALSNSPVRPAAFAHQMIWVSLPLEVVFLASGFVRSLALELICLSVLGPDGLFLWQHHLF